MLAKLSLESIFCHHSASSGNSSFQDGFVPKKSNSNVRVCTSCSVPDEIFPLPRLLDQVIQRSKSSINLSLLPFDPVPALLGLLPRSLEELKDEGVQEALAEGLHLPRLQVQVDVAGQPAGAPIRKLLDDVLLDVGAVVDGLEARVVGAQGDRQLLERVVPGRLRLRLVPGDVVVQRKGDALVQQRDAVHPCERRRGRADKDEAHGGAGVGAAEH